MKKIGQTIQDFTLAFRAYVRSDPEGIGIVDTRDATARKYCALPVEQIIEFMEDAPADLAAVLSCCVAVKQACTLEGLPSSKRSAALRSMESAGQLPLYAAPAHPAQAMLNGLIKDKKGHGLYAKIVWFLSAAREEAGIRPHLYGWKPAAHDVAKFDDVVEPAEAEQEDRDGLDFDTMQYPLTENTDE